MARADILERLLGSKARLRLLKLFILNQNEVFDMPRISLRIHMSAGSFQKEIRMLLGVGFIKRASRVVTETHDKSQKLVRKKLNGFALVRDFPYINEIAELIASDTPRVREKLIAGARGLGKVDLMVIAGQLLGNNTESTDLFIVGSTLKKSKIDSALAALEADLGKEITYALMTTREFQYRFGMYDRFIKNLFDNPHEVLVNKLGV
jgi:hypothetical protein